MVSVDERMRQEIKWSITVVFESPDMFTEFGGVSEFSVAKWSGVVSVSCQLKWEYWFLHLSVSTELSKHIWTLKRQLYWSFYFLGAFFRHTHHIVAPVKDVTYALKEKFLIICQPDLSTLNKRNELVSSCRHRNKALLRNSWHACITF